MDRFLKTKSLATITPQWCAQLEFFTHEKEAELYLPITAVFSILQKKDQILLVFNPERNKWEFPGGHVSKEEIDAKDYTGAIYRETLEEANIEIKTMEPSFIARVSNNEAKINKETGEPYPMTSHFLFFNILSYQEHDGEFLHEITERKWFSLEEAHSLVNATNQTVLEILQKAIKND